MKKKVVLCLSSQYSLLFTDLILRIVILVFSLISSSFTNSISPFLIVLINLITILIYFYFIKRRKKGIVSYLRSRAIAYSDFGGLISNYKVKLKADKGVFNLLTTLSSIVLCSSIIVPLVSQDVIFVDENDPTSVIYLFSSFIITFLLFNYNHKNFVREDVVSVEINNETISNNKLQKFKGFLNNDFNFHANELHFKNDDWIIEINRKLKEFTTKVETFLIESVFLGALTFSAFLVIVGPEGFAEIPKAEMYQYSLDIENKDSNIEVKSEYLMNEFIDAIINFRLEIVSEYFNDLEKLYFLIACGSIICSVFYIAVLVKRYPLIRNIEILSSGLDRARVWKKREETILTLELENIDLPSTSSKLKKVIQKRKYYSNIIQDELANCERNKMEIETKLKLISFIRLIGLYLFFIVLFISSRIIHPNLSIVLSFILIYAIITAKLIDYNYVSFFKSQAYKKFKKRINF